jgi:hypothetical protein
MKEQKFYLKHNVDGDVVLTSKPEESSSYFMSVSDNEVITIDGDRYKILPDRQVVKSE